MTVDGYEDSGKPNVRQTIGLRSTDGYQLARAGEAMEDLRLENKAQYEKGNMNVHAWQACEGARAALADALDKLGEGS